MTEPLKEVVVFLVGEFVSWLVGQWMVVVLVDLLVADTQLGRDFSETRENNSGKQADCDCSAMDLPRATRELQRGVEASEPIHPTGRESHGSCGSSYSSNSLSSPGLSSGHWGNYYNILAL